MLMAPQAQFVETVQLDEEFFIRFVVVDDKIAWRTDRIRQAIS